MSGISGMSMLYEPEDQNQTILNLVQGSKFENYMGIDDKKTHQFLMIMF